MIFKLRACYLTGPKLSEAIHIYTSKIFFGKFFPEKKKKVLRSVFLLEPL